MKKILDCANCKTEFPKTFLENGQAFQIGDNFFCGKKCLTEDRHKTVPDDPIPVNITPTRFRH